MKAHKMDDNVNVFDFDHTIYDGDSTIDFYLFCIKKSPMLLKYLPYQLWHLIFFIIKLESRTVFKGNFFIFIKGINDVEKRISQFWEANHSKIKKWYLERDKSADVIISASPEIILHPILKDLKVHKTIATIINKETGQIIGENCFGKEKVLRFHQTLPGVHVSSAYSDSMHDLPILQMADTSYIVKGSRIVELNEYKKYSLVERLFR